MPAPPVPDWCDARASASPSHPQIVVKEDGKIYRVDGYGHRAEAGYLQMKEDGKTVKEVDGYGHEKPGKLVVKEDGKVYR